MANHYSALKATRQIERRTLVNRTRKTRLRHGIRAMRRALEGKDGDKAQELLPKTFSLVDRAAKWGIIKKNTAARYKSRLHLRLKKLTGTTAPAA
jgi:small subunit ribosomal protein S20